MGQTYTMILIESNREVINMELSKCCKAPVTIGGEDDGFGGTHYYVCTKCGKPCDVKGSIIGKYTRLRAIGLDVNPTRYGFYDNHNFLFKTAVDPRLSGGKVRENAERLASCWNACLPFENPESDIKKLKEEITNILKFPLGLISGDVERICILLKLFTAQAVEEAVKKEQERILKISTNRIWQALKSEE
jgi:hypothetical protein